MLKEWLMYSPFLILTESNCGSGPSETDYCFPVMYNLTSPNCPKMSVTGVMTRSVSSRDLRFSGRTNTMGYAHMFAVVFPYYIFKRLGSF